jgi:hypothetical protein
MSSLIKPGALWVCTLILGCSVAPAAELKQAKFRGWDSSQLKNKLIQLDITPQLGGRILGYQLGDHSFLWANPLLQGQVPPPNHLGPDGNWLNWGGDKLWPAPQGWASAEQWPGPPDPVLDGSPQKARVLARSGASTALELTSPEDPKTGIQFSRVIRIFNGSSRVHVVAAMRNTSTRPIRWGIWTVTQLDAANRVGSGWNPNFYTYAPVNPKSHFAHGYRILFGTESNPEIQPGTASQLLRLDSLDGWLANVDGASGYVFVQSFKFQPNVEYPDGSSVEVWTNGVGTIEAWGRTVHLQADPIENPYIVESELLSPYSRLTPGQHSRFAYDWYSANIGGNFPILSCGRYGCTCQQFKARRSGKQILLNGRFGVFYEGQLGIEFVNAHGQLVGKRKFLDHVSPLYPLFLDSVAIGAPANAVKVRLMIYRSGLERLGKLAETAISQ